MLYLLVMCFSDEVSNVIRRVEIYITSHISDVYNKRYRWLNIIKKGQKKKKKKVSGIFILVFVRTTGWRKKNPGQYKEYNSDNERFARDRNERYVQMNSFIISLSHPLVYIVIFFLFTHYMFIYMCIYVCMCTLLAYVVHTMPTIVLFHFILHFFPIQGLWTMIS